MIKNLKNYPELEWGVMPYPKIPKGKTVIPFGSWGCSITKNSKTQELAAFVINFITSSEACLQFYEANNLIPVKKKAIRRLSESDKMPYKLFAEQLETTSKARPRTPIYPTLSKYFSESVNAVALDKTRKQF